MFILNSLIIFLQRLSIKMFALDIILLTHIRVNMYLRIDKHMFICIYVCLYAHTLLHNATCATALIRE